MTCLYVSYVLGFALFVVSMLAITYYKTSRSLMNDGANKHQIVMRKEKELRLLKAEIEAMKNNKNNEETIPRQPVDFEYS